MKYKLDENLPYQLAEDLEAVGHDVDTARDEGLEGHPDNEVLVSSAADDRMLVTMDIGVGDVRKIPAGHPGVVVIRVEFPSRRHIDDMVLHVLSHPDVDSWKHCIVTVGTNRIRVRKLPT